MKLHSDLATRLTSTDLFYTVHIIAADDLPMQGARSSAATCWPSFDKMMFDWAGGVYICSELTCQLGQLAALPGARWWLHWARHHELAATPGVTMPTWHWNQELLTHWSLNKLVNILHTPFQIHAGCCVFGTSWFYPYIPGAWVTKVNKDFQTWHQTGFFSCAASQSEAMLENLC